MKILILVVMILSGIVIPTAFGDSVPYIFVQIIHKDSQGNLLAYLQSDKMTDIDLLSLTILLNHEASSQDPVHETDDGKLQVITRQFVESFDSPNLIGSSELWVDVDSSEVMSLRFAHDGFRVIPGDTVTTVWNFARLV